MRLPRPLCGLTMLSSSFQSVPPHRPVERPALVEPKTEQPKAEVKAEQAGTQSAKPAVHKTASAPKSEKRRSHKHYWTEGRIISELHRHGIYW